MPLGQESVSSALDDPNGDALRTTAKERNTRARGAPGVNELRKVTTMRRVPRAAKVIVAIVALLATTAMGVAAALAGYLPFGGYERGGYEYSALFGYVPIGGYERGGYEYSP